MTTVDTVSLIDEGRWSTYHTLLIVWTMLAILLDGMDNQLLGNAIPALMRAWSLPRGAFTTALAAGPLGMMAGGVVGGMLGDRIGRRPALVLSVVSFAVPTLAIATAGGVTMLGVLRFCAGLGLGGAMPNAAALVSEYVPRRQRPFAITLTIVCIPLGGTVAALLSGQVLPHYGWRALFVAGGVAPLGIALGLFYALPESPRYLATCRDRWPELVRLLGRLGYDVPADAAFASVSVSTTTSRGAVGRLFAPELRRDTFGLFGAFFFCLLANYIGFSWIVAMLTGAGFAQAPASNALAAFNFGGVAGALVGALIIQKIGSRTTMLGMAALASVSAVVMAGMPLKPPMTPTLIAMFALTGGLLNAVQTTMYALAAHVYPTEIRGTGVGTAVAVGRTGNVLAPYVGAFALDHGGPSTFFTTWAVTMSVVVGSLALIRRHVAPSANRTGA